MSFIVEENTLNITNALNIAHIAGGFGPTGPTGPTDPIDGYTQIFYNSDENKLAYRNNNIGTVNMISGKIENIQVMFYYGISSDGMTASVEKNLRLTRNSTGQWTIIFAMPHPDGVNYSVSFSVEENTSIRDGPILTIDTNSKTPSGFSISINTGDNGGVADTPIDRPFSISIYKQMGILVPI